MTIQTERPAVVAIAGIPATSAAIPALPFTPAENLDPDLLRGLEGAMLWRGESVKRKRIVRLNSQALLGGVDVAHLTIGGEIAINFADDQILRFQAEDIFQHSVGHWDIQARSISDGTLCSLSFRKDGTLGTIWYGDANQIWPLYKDNFYVQYTFDFSNVSQLPVD